MVQQSSPCLYVINLDLENMVIGHEMQEHSPIPNITAQDVLVDKQVFNEVVQFLARGEAVRRIEGDLVVVGRTLQNEKRNFRRMIHERFALEQRKPFDFNGTEIMLCTELIVDLTACVVVGTSFYRWLGDDVELFENKDSAILLLGAITHHKNSIEARRMSFLTECKAAINIMAVRKLHKRLETEEW